MAFAAALFEGRQPNDARDVAANLVLNPGGDRDARTDKTLQSRLKRFFSWPRWLSDATVCCEKLEDWFAADLYGWTLLSEYAERYPGLPKAETVMLNSLKRRRHVTVTDKTAKNLQSKRTTP